MQYFVSANGGAPFVHVGAAGHLAGGRAGRLLLQGIRTDRRGVSDLNWMS